MESFHSLGAEGDSLKRSLLMLVLGSVTSQAAWGAESFAEQRFFLGDLHAHTGASVDGGSSDLAGTCEGGPESCAAVADIHDTARANGLDFWAVTDHVNGTPKATASIWRGVIETVLAGADPKGEYVTIPGGEVWFTIDGRARGHKTLLLLGDDDEVMDVQLGDLDIGGRSGVVDDCAAIWDYTEELEATFGNVLLIPHHPGLRNGMNTDWDCHADERAQWYAPSVEIYSNHGNSEHHETDYDPLWMGADDESTVDAALAPDGHALKLSFIGGTDSHDSRPGSVCTIDTQHSQHPYGGGLTVVALEDGALFDRAAIFDAIQEGRTYATSGPLVPVDVSWSQSGVELGGLGSRLHLDPNELLSLRLTLPDEWQPYVLSVDLVTPEDELGIDAVVTWDDDEEAWVAEVEPVSFGSWVYPRVTLDADSWEGREDCDDGGENEEEVLWLSPNYLSLVTPGEHEESSPLYETTAGPVGEDGAEDARGVVSTRVEEDDGLRVLPVAAGCSSAGLLGSAPLPLAVLWTRRRRRECA